VALELYYAVEYDVRFTIPYDMSCNGLAGNGGGGSSSTGSTIVMTMSTT
jgi:hypothetical protein